MTTGLILYEDSRWRDLRPLTDALVVPALAFGASHLAARWMRFSALPLAGLIARPHALAAWHERPAPALVHADDLIVVNAAALPGPWFEAVRAASAPAVFEAGGVIVAARISAAAFEPARSGMRTVEDVLAAIAKATVIDVRRIAWPWDLIAWNAAAIDEDLEGMAAVRDGDVHPAAVLLAPERIAIHRGARIDPLAVLDARGGSILVEAGAIVLAHTTVIGPCVVGARTQLLGGFISRSTFGPECRVAGEVEECVWQGYGNKRHYGFVGHSVIGEWVNLGALTTTSDLKNNYGSVRVWIDGREIDSGSSKVGSLVGAHVKTGIGSLLPTGASIGTGSNLFAGGTFAPKDVASFSWWDGERFDDHQLEPFLKTAKIAMSRRGRVLTPADLTLLREAFAASAPERERQRSGAASGPATARRAPAAGA